MNYINKLKLTWISFFSYSFTGALVIVTGVVLGNIADHFQLPVSKMSNIFTFLNLGILVSIFLNTWLMKIFSIKKQLILGFLLMIPALIGLISSYNLIIFSFSIFMLGIISGITMAIGTYLITYLYDGSQRGAFLLFTDSFFSMAGILFPMLAGILLSNHFTWYWIYICIGILYTVIFVLTILSYFPILTLKNVISEEKKQDHKKWKTSIILLSLSALCYIFGQLSFISWVPEYVISRFYINIKESGKLVSNFWFSYMVGMWIFSLLLRFFDLQRIVTVLTAISAVIMYLFVNSNDYNSLSLILIGLGFFSSAIYTTIITLGSQQTNISSPKIVNFILICGTIGSMLTFVITGPIVARYSIIAVLHLSNVLYVVVFVLCFLLGFCSAHRVNYGINSC